MKKFLYSNLASIYEEISSPIVDHVSAIMHIPFIKSLKYPRVLLTIPDTAL